MRYLGHLPLPSKHISWIRNTATGTQTDTSVWDIGFTNKRLNPPHHNTAPPYKIHVIYLSIHPFILSIHLSAYSSHCCDMWPFGKYICTWYTDVHWYTYRQGMSVKIIETVYLSGQGLEQRPRLWRKLASCYNPVLTCLFTLLSVSYLYTQTPQQGWLLCLLSLMKSSE